MKFYKCQICKKPLDDGDAYEYRGAIGCAEHFDEVCGRRDLDRAQIIREEMAKTEVFRGLDLGDSAIGKANREILKPQIEIANQESARLRAYERGSEGGR